jgi:hypothetical protein
LGTDCVPPGGRSIGSIALDHPSADCRRINETYTDRRIRSAPCTSRIVSLTREIQAGPLANEERARRVGGADLWCCGRHSLLHSVTRIREA